MRAPLHVLYARNGATVARLGRKKHEICAIFSDEHVHQYSIFDLRHRVKEHRNHVNYASQSIKTTLFRRAMPSTVHGWPKPGRTKTTGRLVVRNMPFSNTYAFHIDHRNNQLPPSLTDLHDAKS